MSSDNQYTALGQSYPPGTPFGFYTDGTNITYGVNVQGVVTDPTDPNLGNGCGVYASAVTEPSNRTSQANSRPGVWAIGDHYGVYGASNFLYDTTPSPVVDHTPVLSSDIANGGTAKDPTPVVGGIGVVGAGYKAPGVVGTAALTDAEASSTTVGSGVISNIVQTSVGVVGMVGTPPPIGVLGNALGCAGVIGVSLNDMPANTLKSPLDLGVEAVLQDAQGTILTPGFGMGLFGWSFRGRGGVFASASPIPPTAITPPKDILNLASAQIRLVPAPVSQAPQMPTSPLAGTIAPQLPKTGQPGDLMAVTVTNADGVQQTRLWFCVADEMWAAVQLGDTMIQGSYTPTA